MSENPQSAAGPEFDEAPVRALLEDCDGDLDAITELVELYLTQTVERVQTLRAAFDRGALDQVQYAAHDLKSTSGAFGAVHLSQSAALLEAQARSRAVAPELVHRVISAFDRVHPQLTDLLGRLRLEGPP